MGIGDLSILISNIHAISKKLSKPVTVLAQKNTRAHAILKYDPHIEEVIELDEKEIKSFFTIIKKIKPKRFDQSYIFSDSMRFYLVSKLSGIKENFQYKFFSKKVKTSLKPQRNLLKKYYTWRLILNQKFILIKMIWKKLRKNLIYQIKQKM